MPSTLKNGIGAFTLKRKADESYMLFKALIMLSILACYGMGYRYVIRNGGFQAAPLFGVFYLSMALFNGLGCFYVIWPRFSQISHLSSEMSASFFFIIVFQILAFYLFFWLSSRYRPTGSQPRIFNSQNNPTLFLSLSFWAISLILVSAYISIQGLPFIFSLNPLDLGRSSLIALRSTALQLQYGVLVKGFYFFPTIAGTLGYIFYLDASNDGKTPSPLTRLIAWGGIVLASLLCVAFLHKTPLIFFLLSLWLARILSGRSARLKYNFLFAILLAVCVLGLYFVYNPDRSLSQYVSTLLPGIVRRIAGSYTQSLEAVIRLVQNEGTFGGSSLSNPGGLFPYVPVDLPTILHFEIMGKTGNAPVGAAGEGYANFGMLGAIFFVLLSNFYVFFAQLVTDQLGAKDKSLKVALAVFFSLSIFRIPISSISLSMMDPFNFIALLVILSVVYIRNRSYGPKLETVGE